MMILQDWKHPGTQGKNRLKKPQYIADHQNTEITPVMSSLFAALSEVLRIRHTWTINPLRKKNAYGSRWRNLVAACKAVRGGWQIGKGEEILSPESRNEMLERTSWGGLLDSEKPEVPVDEKARRDWQWLDW